MGPVCDQRIVDKLEDISVLFFAGGNCRPYAFAPAHTGLAASALCDASVDHGVANLSFGPVIRRLDVRVGQEAEIIFRRFALESSRQVFAQGMVRRTTNATQESLLNLFHLLGKAFGRECIATMQRFEQLFKPAQQLIAPTR